MRELAFQGGDGIADEAVVATMGHFGIEAGAFEELRQLFADPPALEQAAFSLHLRVSLEAA
eukprot:10393699-Lingulodinium_polyedra.AAC.1